MTSVQLLSPDGTLTPSDDVPFDVTPELCRNLYRHMALARRLDEEAVALQRQGELGLWLQCAGQEAAQVGSVTALKNQDWIFPSYRDHAAALARGISPAELLSQWRGCSAAGWDPHAYRFHVYTLVLAAQLPQAVGFAMGAQRDSADEVVMTYFGDGASSEGDASEAFNLAATSGAPVIFFCQNNHWAISTPSNAQSRTPIHLRAAGFGLDSYLVDGNDVLAVHAVTTMAAEQARSGSGPVLIEATTYRIGGHSTSDDPTKYRASSEVDLWRTRDPLTRLKRLLSDKRWADHTFFTSLEDEAEQLGSDVRQACLSLEPQPVSEVFDLVLAGGSSSLARERDQYLEYAATFSDRG